MCGIAGIARATGPPPSTEALTRMAAAIRHRGPDGFGLLTGRRVGFAHVRLSIIDPELGAQPMTNERGDVIVVYNGEAYNYVELRDRLAALGHTFRTRSDTEVLVHGYEEWGTTLLDRLNGQFAFAIYDRRRERLFLARDRFGIRPLFYAARGGTLYFASEIKALFAGGVEPEPDARGLDEVFTFWAARAPRTAFRGVLALEPGTYAIWDAGRLRTARYYHVDYPEADEEPADAVAAIGELLSRATRLRMRADVSVGGYLSGGLDSSVTCSLASGPAANDLRTFSIAFGDPAFDESVFQRRFAAAIGCERTVRRIRSGEIARVFPDVVRHAETPVVRTAPAPLFLLSRLTRDHGIKVVLTGEGADEVFLGYDLFKQTRVRLFCLRQPQSARRPRLFDRLYPHLRQGGRGAEFWRRALLDAGAPTDPLFSHLPRIRSTSWIKQFYAADMRTELAGDDPLDRLRGSLPPRFRRWTPLNRAAYLELVTFLEPYLLSSQGDRMAMAHGVETRLPFLDHHLFELSAALPVSSKLRVLREKDILRRWARGRVPTDVVDRRKQPYRAPDAQAFFEEQTPKYVEHLLDPARVREAGVFDPDAVAGLLRRGRSGRVSRARENQAFIAILSTQIWYDTFLEGTASRRPDRDMHPDVLLREPDVPLPAQAPQRILHGVKP